MGIDAGGGFAEVFSEPAPTGAILHRRAVQEYDNTRRLCAAGVPSFVPLAVVKYDRSFAGEPLGAVATLSPSPYPYRLDRLLCRDQPQTADETRWRDAATAMLGVRSPITAGDGPTTFAWIGDEIGSRVRQLADTGLYRHSSGVENFSLCPDTSRALFTDLDSSRELDELAPELAAMQIAREVAGALHKLIDELYHPAMLDLDLDALLADDPVQAMVSALFHDAPADGVQALAATVWDYALPHVMLLRRHRDRFDHDWDHERRQTYKVDRDPFYVAVMIAVIDLLQATALGQTRGPGPSRDQLVRWASDFLGDRTAFVQHLIGGYERRRGGPDRSARV